MVSHHAADRRPQRTHFSTSGNGRRIGDVLEEETVQKEYFVGLDFSTLTSVFSIA
jgi:hypothetical protein